MTERDIPVAHFPVAIFLSPTFSFPPPLDPYPADMHGNAAEWCLSNYAPYPYDPHDGRDNAGGPGLKVVRGSWNDLAKDSSSSSRWRYQPCQPICNVGFRVPVEIGSEGVAKTAAKRG